MALAQMPLTGSVRGLFGNSIFYDMYGKHVVRSKPVIYNDRKSDPQLVQRENFHIAQEYILPLKTLLRVGWRSQAIGMSAYNAVSSYMMKTVLFQKDGKWAIDPEKLMHAKGPLCTAESFTVINPDTQVITYSWEDNTMVKNSHPYDTFCFLCLNLSSGKASWDMTTHKRTEGTFTLSLPADWSGNEVAFYAFFYDETKRIVSNDTFITSFTLQ